MYSPHLLGAACQCCLLTIFALSLTIRRRARLNQKGTTPPATEDAPRLHRIVYASPRCVCIDTSGVMSLVTSARLPALYRVPLPRSYCFPNPRSSERRCSSFVFEPGQARPDAARRLPTANRPYGVSPRIKPAGRCAGWNRDSDLGDRPGGQPGGPSPRNCCAGWAGTSLMVRAKVTPSSDAWCVGA